MATTKEIIHRFLGQLSMQLLYPMLSLHIPWVFYALIRPLSFSVAISISFLVFMVMNIKALRQKMLLPWVSVFAFFLTFIPTMFLSKINHLLWLVPQLFFILVIIISLLIKKPFTLQYAKQSTPSNRWKTPLFFKVNSYLAMIWLFYFCLSTAITIAHYFLKWPISALSFFLLWGTAHLHDKFPIIYFNYLKEDRISSRNF